MEGRPRQALLVGGGDFGYWAILNFWRGTRILDIEIQFPLLVSIVARLYATDRVTLQPVLGIPSRTVAE